MKAHSWCATQCVLPSSPVADAAGNLYGSALQSCHSHAWQEAIQGPACQFCKMSHAQDPRLMPLHGYPDGSFHLVGTQSQWKEAAILPGKWGGKHTNQLFWSEEKILFKAAPS